MWPIHKTKFCTMIQAAADLILGIVAGAVITLVVITVILQIDIARLKNKIKDDE